MKINTKVDEGIWFDYDEEVKFLLRPYPISSVDPSLDLIQEGKKDFMYCVVDWHGLVDENNNPFKCTEENKAHVYDYYLYIREFVVDKVASMILEASEQAKN